jgi:hypothetical protein
MSGHPTRVNGSRSFCGARQPPRDEISDRSPVISADDQAEPDGKDEMDP